MTERRCLSTSARRKSDRKKKRGHWQRKKTGKTVLLRRSSLKTRAGSRPSLPVEKKENALAAQQKKGGGQLHCEPMERNVVVAVLSEGGARQKKSLRRLITHPEEEKGNAGYSLGAEKEK